MLSDFFDPSSLSCPQASLLDLKEHASSLASSGLKKDSKLKSLEITLEQKKEECIKLESQLKKVSPDTWSITASKYNSRLLSHYADWHAVSDTLTTLKTLTLSWAFPQVHFTGRVFPLLSDRGRDVSRMAYGQHVRLTNDSIQKSTRISYLTDFRHSKRAQYVNSHSNVGKRWCLTSTLSGLMAF